LEILKTAQVLGLYIRLNLVDCPPARLLIFQEPMAVAESGTETGTETESEAKARRSVHVVGATIILLTMIGVIWGVTGGNVWAKKRQLKAIQQVVRADLELVKQAQEKFFKRNGFYTTDLEALDLWPKRVMYAFGFVKAASFAEAKSLEGLNPEMRTILQLATKRAQDAIDKAKADRSFKADPPIILSPMTGIRNMDFDRLSSFCPDCTASQDTYKMIAAANLDDDSVLDVWTIDQTGKIEHLIDDLQ
jgi:hypothetical protein